MIKKSWSHHVYQKVSLLGYHYFCFLLKKISKDETDDSDYVVSFITISLGCYLRIPSGQGNIMVNILRCNSFLNCQFISFGARKKNIM